MADEPAAATAEQTAEQPSQEQQAEQTQQLYAGKFESTDALTDGIRNIAKQLGHDVTDETEIVGNNGWFKTMQEAEAGYKALERMHGRRQSQSKEEGEDKDTTETVSKEGEDKPSEDQDKPPDSLQIEQPSDEDVSTEAILQRAGLDGKELADEFTQNGDISDDSFQKLKQHHPLLKNADDATARQMVKEHLAGLQAQAQLQQQTLQSAISKATEAVGGQDRLNSLLKWAGSNLDQDTVQKFNQRLADPGDVEDAVDALARRYERTTGRSLERSKPVESDTGSDNGAAGRTITDRKTYFEVQRKARQGDAQAQEQLRRHIENGGGRFH